MDSHSPTAWANAFVNMVSAINHDERSFLALRHLADAIDANTELRDKLNDPSIPVADRVSAVADVVNESSRPVAALIAALIVAENVRLLRRIADESWRRSVEAQGVQVARVRVAHRLTVSQEDALIAKLTQVAGRPVMLDVTVDPDLIGGITVDLNGELRDASIARRLEDLHHAIAEAH
ncbi:ATP synthase F1 subunit delta [Stomatohabitans albus]|uniref:ATP synthase F1 subunit delta n=1 Tax=Stomatohabitans albus TaxID=3110766 RepID=UPI00300C290A